MIAFFGVLHGPAAEARTLHRVRVGDTRFRPDVVLAALGDPVRWTSISAVRHEIASDPHGFFRVSLTPGEQASRTFRSAGTFAYDCRLFPSMRGVIRIPVQARPKARATPGARITIEVATARIPGTTYNVQWRSDDSGWVTFRTGIHERRAFFRAESTGTLYFRARVHDGRTGATSGWSPSDDVLIVPIP